MARTQRKIDEAKAVESLLCEIGEHEAARRVAAVRKGYLTAIKTLRTLHRDNMELRQELGLPSFLDAQKAEDT